MHFPGEETEVQKGALCPHGHTVVSRTQTACQGPLPVAPAFVPAPPLGRGSLWTLMGIFVLLIVRSRMSTQTSCTWTSGIGPCALQGRGCGRLWCRGSGREHPGLG